MSSSIDQQAPTRRERVREATRVAAAYPPPVVHSGLQGWAAMHGLVSLELFGHMGAVADHEAFYIGHMRDYCALIGLDEGGDT